METDNNMCKALKKLIKDEIDVHTADGEAHGEARVEYLMRSRALDSAVGKLSVLCTMILYILM